MAKTEITLSAAQADVIHDTLIKARQTVNAINPNLGNQLMDCAKIIELEQTDPVANPNPIGVTAVPDEPVAETTDAGDGENTPTPDGPEEPAEPEAS